MPNSTTALAGFSFFIVIIGLPQRFQIVNGNDTVMAGVHLLPMLVALGTGAVVGAMVSIRRNHTFPVLCIASCFVLTGCGLLSTASGDLKIPSSLYGYQVIHGFGVGLTMGAITLMVAVEAEFQDAGKLLANLPESNLTSASNRSRHSLPGSNFWRQCWNCDVDNSFQQQSAKFPL